MMKDIIERSNAPNKVFLFILGRQQAYIGGISVQKKYLHKLGEIVYGSL